MSSLLHVIRRYVCVCCEGGMDVSGIDRVFSEASCGTCCLSVYPLLFLDTPTHGASIPGQ